MYFSGFLECVCVCADELIYLFMDCAHDAIYRFLIHSPRGVYRPYEVHHMYIYEVYVNFFRQVSLRSRSVTIYCSLPEICLFKNALKNNLLTDDLSKWRHL